MGSHKKDERRGQSSKGYGHAKTDASVASYSTLLLAHFMVRLLQAGSETAKHHGGWGRRTGHRQVRA